MCATTSILPSPCWLICTMSPRFPTRPSTLILSWRNFSNAETSKILSEAGCEALIMNYMELAAGPRAQANRRRISKEPGDSSEHTFFVTFAGFWPLVAGRVALFYIHSAYCSSSPDPREEGLGRNSKAMRVKTYCCLGGSHCNGLSKGRKEIDILRLVLWLLMLRWRNFFHVGLRVR